MQPAHFTKHLPFLQLSFQASQFSLSQLDNGQHNGTAVWLSGQALALTLPALLSKRKGRQRAIELGSGTGFTAFVLVFSCPFISLSFRLALCSLGWDVIATDTHGVLSSVLQRNVDSNRINLPPGSGTIQTRELDWTVKPENWIWNHPAVIASHEPGNLKATTAETLNPPFDLIITADTLYSPELVTPLLRTLHALSESPSFCPSVFITLERRDSRLADDALQQARTVWSFSTQRVPDRKVVKAMAKAGCKWDRVEWEGVEIWRLTLKTT
ncbi:hypothetical protein K439DRAFT_1636643 [Ramaria rubella]|nr:hypothetical protein K439DRAFT_1636643 [Ramaria rubella]